MQKLRVLVFLVDVELLRDAKKGVDEPVKGHSARKHERNPGKNYRHGVHHDFCLLVVGCLRCELCLQKHHDAE